MLVLVLGLVLAAAPLVSDVPQDRVVTVRLAEPSTIARVELTWLDGEGDLLRSSAYDWGRGRAPAELSRTFSLPEGRLQLTTVVWRHPQGAPGRASVDVSRGTQELTFDDDVAETVVHVR